MMNDYFSDLDQEPVVAQSAPAAATETYPCQVCNGTGKYRGVRIHQDQSHCFACKGTGYFKTSPHERQKAAAKRKASKQAKIEAVQEQNAKSGLMEDFAELQMYDWNDFARSMIDQNNAGRLWSENQIAAARRMIAKTRESRAQRDAERASAEVSVDLSPVMQMFEKASEKLKRPSYRALGLKITKASPDGRNAGALYIKSTSGEYLGKVLDGKFKPSFGTPNDIKDKLFQIAADPAEIARVHGKETGECCCCGRELTDPNSIAAGIGPICAENWGF